MHRAVLKAFVLVSVLSSLYGAPRRVMRVNLDPHYLKAISAYKRLEPKLTRQELKTITTIGILNGALKAERDMEKHLTEIVTDFILNTNMSDPAAAIPKVKMIEETIERDKNAIKILSSAMDLATKSLTLKEYNNQMQKTLEEHKSKKRETVNSKDIDMDSLKTVILDHMQNVQKKITKKIDSTLDYLEENKELEMVRVNRKRNAAQSNDLQDLFDEDKVENNLVDNQPVQEDEKVVNIPVDTVPKDVVEISTGNGTKKENQLENSDEGSGGDDGGMPGGLLGIIAGLSGGEGGSDVGALVGAITGLVGQIFGPGGLDIDSLISTGTSLIAGLLAGDKNFGAVLGGYVGTAFDGLSGGGGAVNNGKFVGNLLGSIVAALSANPDDEDLPPQPLVFVQSLIQGFKAAKNRAGSPEDDDAGKPSHPPAGGSDSFGFVKQIVSALVGGVTSLVLNTALGASGGSSQASTAAISSSSHPQQMHKHSW